MENGVQINQLVSVDSNIAQKSNISNYKNFQDLSEKYKIPLYMVNKYTLKTSEDQSFFKEQTFDLMVVSGWQRLIPDKILETLKFIKY